MLINTKEFKEVASAILLAVDENAANLELAAKDANLRLNVTNREYYVSKIFHLSEAEEFHAVVDAQLFLGLISGITTETFELSIKDNVVLIKAGKSKYKAPMIYENDSLAALTPITVKNVTVSMGFPKDVMQSILNVNSKELLKVKNLDVNPLQKLYYIDETGCFTFTTGATVNKFVLEKPIKLLLNDKIVKLFRLFQTNATLYYGVDASADGSAQTKIVISTADTYLSAVINADDVLLNDIQRPCAAAKSYIDETYANHLVVSSTELSAAVARLMLFTKNRVANQNMRHIPATVAFTETEMSITDALDNTEVVGIEAGSYVDSAYSMVINLADLKLVLDSCKNEHITINCGNHRSIIINRGAITNLLPESRMM
jgi:DNA polymerase III sliding clamp (beta) subunit (PCNA family)